MWEGRVIRPSKSPASLLTSPEARAGQNTHEARKSGDALTPTPARFPKFVPRPSASSPCPRPAHTPRAHASKHAFTQTKNSLSSPPRHSETLARQPVSRDFRAGGGGRGGFLRCAPALAPREAANARVQAPSNSLSDFSDPFAHRNSPPRAATVFAEETYAGRSRCPASWSSMCTCHMRCRSRGRCG